MPINFEFENFQTWPIFHAMCLDVYTHNSKILITESLSEWAQEIIIEKSKHHTNVKKNDIGILKVEVYKPQDKDLENIRPLKNDLIIVSASSI